MKKFLWLFALIITLIVGTKLRLVGYGVIPDPYVILDEHTNVWHGLSLRATGVPAAWSILEVYRKDSKELGAGGYTEELNISVDGEKPTFNNFRNFPNPSVAVSEFDFGRGLSQTQLVQPYLDHPLFGALVLSTLVSRNVKGFADLNSYSMRHSSQALAILTQILIFVLAWQLTKKPIIGIFASLVYATAPSFNLLSRYALLENVMSPLILLMIITLIYSRSKDNNKLLLTLAGVLGGLIALTKLSGWVFILGTIVLLFLWKEKIKNIFYYALPAFVIGSLYFFWGLYLSPKLFIDLLILQGGREFIGAINLIVTTFRVSIFNFPVDGWWIGGFVSLLFIPKKKEYLPVVVMTVAGLFSALAVSGANYPWYFITLIPFMAIATAIFLYKLATDPTVTDILITFLIFASSSLYWGFGVYQSSQPFMIYRILFLASIMATFLRIDKWWRVVTFVLIFVLFALNFRSLLFILGHWGKLPLIYTPGTF